MTNWKWRRNTTSWTTMLNLGPGRGGWDFHCSVTLCCALSICICEPFALPRTFPAPPAASVFSVPNAIHTYSSSNPTFLRFQPASLVWLRIFSLFAAHRQRTGEEAVKKGEPSTPRGDNRVGRYGQAIRSRMARAQRGITSNVSSVDELRQHHRILEPTPPLPTQPSVSVIPSVTTSALTTTMPATPTKGGRMLLSRIGSDKRWGVGR